MIVADLVESLRKLPQDAELVAKTVHHKIIMFPLDHDDAPVLQLDMDLLGVAPIIFPEEAA